MIDHTTARRHHNGDRSRIGPGNWAKNGAIGSGILPLSFFGPTGFRTRLIPERLLGGFERTTWRVVTADTAARTASRGPKLDISARMRGMAILNRRTASSRHSTACQALEITQSRNRWGPACGGTS